MFVVIVVGCLILLRVALSIISTDDEDALNKEAIQKYLKDQIIEHHRTRAHPNFSERAIRTSKDMLCRRVEADENARKTEHLIDRLYIRNIISMQ